VRAGLVRKLSEIDGRLRVDGTKTLHDHAICQMCGAIFDVKPDPNAVPTPPSELPGGLDVRVEYDVVYPKCKLTSI